MSLQASLSLELAAVLPAPRERVFAMLTDREQLPRWWGPRGFATPEVDLDLRVGGPYRFTMQPPDGAPFHLAGKYLRVEPPGCLELTFRWEEPAPDDRETVVRLSLEEDGGVTHVALVQSAFLTEERVALHRAGWTESFDRLRAVLRADAGDGGTGTGG